LEAQLIPRAAEKGGNGARQRNWRARQRRGAAIYSVEADFAVLHLLIDLGWLREDESADRREVAVAIGALLADAARCRRKSEFNLRADAIAVADRLPRVEAHSRSFVEFALARWLGLDVGHGLVTL
jgi:hypothetical protein